MESLTGVVIFAVVVFIVSVIMSRIPFVFKNAGSHLHAMLALSTGIMLGVLFLLILPEAVEESGEAGLSMVGIFSIILVGFLAVYVINFMLNVRNGNEHTHEFTSKAAFGGLAIHAVFDGISLAAGFAAGENVGMVILVAMCVHKCAEVFSLSSTMAIALGRKEATLYMTAFSAVTPLAMVVAYFLISGEPTLTGPAMALSSGILLFVVMCDMLPEVFHHVEEDGPGIRMGAFIGGILVAAAVWAAIFVLTDGAGL